MYWCKHFHCFFSESVNWRTVSLMPLNDFDTAMSVRSYNIYNCMYAVADALRAILFKDKQWQPMRNKKVMIFPPWQVMYFLLDGMQCYQGEYWKLFYVFHPTISIKCKTLHIKLIDKGFILELSWNHSQTKIPWQGGEIRRPDHCFCPQEINVLPMKTSSMIFFKDNWKGCTHLLT